MDRATRLLSLLLCLCSLALVSLGQNNSTDKLALISFKAALSLGSSSPVASWNTSTHYCSWAGVVCGRRHPDRVVALRMGSFNLSGRISPSLGNLSFLRELDLNDNQLVEQVPPELGHLVRLQVLNLSTNLLQGSIPVTVAGCTKLKLLVLSKNQLQGQIPHEVGQLKNLAFLNLRENRLSGGVPHLSNLTSLQNLDLSNNMLSGAVPSSLGTLPSLHWVNLSNNTLSGLIPASLWNMSSLLGLSVRMNMLSGIIPPNAFDNVPRLRSLIMDNNQFHGPIPVSISNASDMTTLQLGFNFFSGVVPVEVGSLRNLSWLQLSDTLLQANEPKDWEFLTALTNCSQLKLLGLANSKFGGVLPDSISNLSTSLKTLYLYGNEISGSIPKHIGNLINLEKLVLSNNSLTGFLPSSLCRLKNLVILYAYYNNLMGTIPVCIGNLTELIYMQLETNDFSGTIPTTIGNLTQLWELSLSNNYLMGPIPATIFSIPMLSYTLDLSYNSLEGPLPQEIGKLSNLVEFRAESNNLSGEIPATILQCQLLQNLFLQNNALTGSIPLLWSQLSGLEALDLSSNNLTGQIPMSLGSLRLINYLNLSFNKFAGEVPNFGVFANVSAISIQGNDKLCGGIPDLHLPKCSNSLPLLKRKHKFLVIPIVASLATMVVLPLFCKLLMWHNKRKAKIPSTDSPQGHPLISYLQLVRATDGFSATNLLGSGSFGSVYKGKLNDQEGEGTSVVAVKVLKLQTPKALKSFTSECETLRHVRHRNLVKIITVCSSIDSRGTDFKAIVYDFMPNGSLEGWLHPDLTDHAEQRYLSLLERVTILLDVAYALDYLHYHGPEPVVHCDLKPSNVLLDADMVAHVGDFGLAKILVQGSSLVQQSTSSMGLRGTIGYAAPEYGAGNMASTLGDIYSYGILVLETVTEKRPTDGRFRQGLSLREHVDLALQNRLMDAVDTRLSLDLQNELRTTGQSSSYKRKMDCLVSLLRLGLSCTEELPSSRMPIEGIIKELIAIKDSLLPEHRT